MNALPTVELGTSRSTRRELTGPPSARGASRVGAVCWITLGLGFGLPCLYGIWHLARFGEIAMFLGYPTYGRGPFETAGVATTVPLLAGFAGVCAGQVVAGCLLWGQRRAGTVLALGLLPFAVAYWAGFDLPYAWPIGIAGTLAAVLATRGNEVVR